MPINDVEMEVFAKEFRVSTMMANEGRRRVAPIHKTLSPYTSSAEELVSQGLFSSIPLTNRDLLLSASSTPNAIGY